MKHLKFYEKVIRVIADIVTLFVFELGIKFGKQIERGEIIEQHKLDAKAAEDRLRAAQIEALNKLLSEKQQTQVNFPNGETPKAQPATAEEVKNVDFPNK